MIVNEEYFTGSKLAEQLKYAAKGLLKPEPDKLKVGHYYYRVGHSGNPAAPSDEEVAAAFSSPWWMDFEALKSIANFSDVNGVSLTVAGRIKNAVAPAFGKSNILVRGLLAEPAKALIGAGRPIESDGNVFFPPGNLKQIFIPGLYGTTLADRIFPESHRSVDAISSGRIVVNGE